MSDRFGPQRHAQTPQPQTGTAPFRGTLAPIARISGQFLLGCLFAAFAFVLWPEEGYAWWQFRVLSGICAFVAALIFVQAIKAIREHQKRERLFDELDRLGRQPRGSSLAGDDDLNRAGMR